MRFLISALWLLCASTACTRSKPEELRVPASEVKPQRFPLKFSDGGEVVFEYYVLDAEKWHAKAKARLGGLLHDLRRSPVIRARLGERERAILDRLRIEVINSDRVIWSSTVRGGVETIEVSYGALWFVEEFAANMSNMLVFDDYRFMTLLLEGERAYDRRLDRRWFTAEAYRRGRGYEVPSVLPPGFEHFTMVAELQMVSAGALHELCHLFHATAGPDAKVKLEGKSRDERLAIRTRWELEADRCAGDHLASIGALAQMGMAMVLGVAAVADDPAQSVHPPTAERIALLQDLSDRALMDLLQQGKIGANAADSYRELMRRYGAILEHVGSPD